MRGLFIFYLLSMFLKLVAILVGGLLLFGFISALLKDVFETILIRPVIQLKMLDSEITVPPNSVVLYINISKLGVASEEISDICMNKTCLCTLSFRNITIYRDNPDNPNILIETKYNPGPTYYTFSFRPKTSLGWEAVQETNSFVYKIPISILKELQDKDAYQEMLYLFSDVNCLEVEKIFYLDGTNILEAIVNEREEPLRIHVSYIKLDMAGQEYSYIISIDYIE